MKEVKSVADFDTIINSGKPVMLDFYADWCGPCRALMPTVEKLAAEHESNFVIAKVNVDQNPELAQKFSVRSIPALFFMKNGEVKEQLGGVQSESVLQQKIQKYSSLTAN